MTKLAATNQGVSERTRQLEREARQLEHERGQSSVCICFLRCCACFTRRAVELFQKNAGYHVEYHACAECVGVTVLSLLRN